MTNGCRYCLSPAEMSEKLNKMQPDFVRTASESDPNDPYSMQEHLSPRNRRRVIKKRKAGIRLVASEGELVDPNKRTRR